MSWDPNTCDSKVIAADLKEPYGLTVDSNGDLIVADKLHHRLCRLKEGKLEKIDVYDSDNHRRKGSSFSTK